VLCEARSASHVLSAWEKYVKENAAEGDEEGG
jgi:hypothetical protein